MMPYDQKLHDKFMLVAAALDESLMLLRAPKKGDPGERFGVDAARVLSAKVIKQAFNTYTGQASLTDKQMATMLPEMRGALKIVNVLVKNGARVPLPVISKFVVDVSRAVRKRQSGVAR